MVKNSEHNEKKILIVSSIGGGGHIAVTTGLKEALEPEYDVVVGIMLQEILAPVDWIQQVTFGKSSGEKFYNYCLKIKANRVINLMAWASDYFFGCYANKIKKLIGQYLARTEPDIIISVAPYFNGYLAEVAAHKNVPLIVIPTDLDATTFVQGIKGREHQSLTVALSFDDAGIARRAYIPNNKPIITGFPVRATFLVAHTKKMSKKILALVRIARSL